ncbi:MAG: DUF4292 domain-containing protein, partial [Thermoguttaceae bacterium]|nr:DUF4292 domain-containing protein [Thermoguttaceae bacterium]
MSVANSPGWAKCQLVFQRPNRVRVIGTGNIVGRVLDCGCNDDTFWFWSKLQDPPQLAYCKISEFQNSSLHNIIPIDPTWFPEAFGVVELKTEEIIEGPTSQSDGTLLIVTKRTRPDGQYTKYTYIDPKTAAIKRQDILDPTNTPVISVVCNEFQLESTQNVVLPKKINIECPKTGESLSLDLGNLSINATDSITAQTFTRPSAAELGNAMEVNLGTVP